MNTSIASGLPQCLGALNFRARASLETLLLALALAGGRARRGSERLLVALHLLHVEVFLGDLDLVARPRRARHRRRVRQRLDVGALPQGDRLPIAPHPVHAHRARDVLQLLGPEVVELAVDLVVDVVVHDARDAHPAALGEALQARRDVHAVAEQVVVLVDHVAEVDPHAQRDLARRVLSRLVARHRGLDRFRPACRFDDARELEQQPVAGGLEDAPAELVDLRLDDLVQDPPEALEGALLVDSHEAAVADHVARHDRREAALRLAAAPARLACARFLEVRSRRRGRRCARRLDVLGLALRLLLLSLPPAGRLLRPAVGLLLCLALGLLARLALLFLPRRE
jgi:hypothetical protein